MTNIDLADRIPASVDAATGARVTPTPPSGGSWTIDAEGALVPRDKDTALRAGLAWREPVAPTQEPTPAPAATKK